MSLIIGASDWVFVIRGKMPPGSTPEMANQIVQQNVHVSAALTSAIKSFNFRVIASDAEVELPPEVPTLHL